MLRGRVHVIERSAGHAAVDESVGGCDAGEGEMGERLCVGCRRTSSLDELLRLAITSEPPWVIPDPRRRLGGRGLSVHPTRDCVEAAAKRGGFARALRRSVAVDVEALCTTAAALYAKRVESLLLVAARRKWLALGTEAVRAALGEGRLELLVVAADAVNRRDELTSVARRLGKRWIVFGTKHSLGKLFSRDELGVLGVLDRTIADEVVRSAAREAELMGRRANAAPLGEAE
jgi:predicted RNA-binding protein YlxR (DUF448 family)